jgi:hypothetical protein
MVNEPIASWRPTPKQGLAYRKEAARLRRLGPDATTNIARKILEDQAQAQERLAGGPDKISRSLPRRQAAA